MPWKFRCSIMFFGFVLCLNGNLISEETSKSQTPEAETSESRAAEKGDVEFEIGEVTIGIGGKGTIALIRGVGVSRTPRWTNDMSLLLSAYPGLENIDFYHIYLCKGSLVPLQRLTKLNRISTLQTNFTDDHLRSISECKNMREIVIHTGTLTDASIPILGSMRQLTLVAIAHNDFFPPNALRQLTQLLPHAQLAVEGEEYIPAKLMKKAELEPALKGK